MIGVVNQYHTGYFELPKQMSACSVHSKTMARHVTSPTLLRAGRRIDAITHVEGEAMGQKLVGHKIDPPRGTEACGTKKVGVEGDGSPREWHCCCCGLLCLFGLVPLHLFLCSRMSTLELPSRANDFSQ